MMLTDDLCQAAPGSTAEMVCFSPVLASEMTSSLGGSDLCAGLVAPDLPGEGVGIGTGSDRVVDELLHRHERVGGLGGPAPVRVRHGVGDGGRFAQRVGTAQLMFGVNVRTYSLRRCCMLSVARPRVVFADFFVPKQHR